MKIFAAEIEAGLEEDIKVNCSLAFLSPIVAMKNVTNKESTGDIAANRVSMNLLLHNYGKVTAGELDSDLYHVNSILVSAGWNKNDDVFVPEEMWIARHTPVHKPDNLGHNEKEIVGHMTALWVVDTEGNSVPDNTPLGNVPDTFHIVTSSVIYKNWTDEELIKRTATLIEEIEAGEMFVSCEALFSGFNYALISPEGKHFLLARNEETAFLTKHLRRFKGSGEYDGYKVGRALSNITFSGKGYVKKPANPDSIILLPDVKNFTKAEKAESLGVLPSCSKESKSTLEMNDMSDENITKLEEKLAAAQKEIVALTEKLAKADVVKLEASIASLDETVKKAEKTAETKTAELDKAVASVKELTETNKTLASKKDELEAELVKIQAESLKASRISALVDGGVAKADAEKTVEKFISLNDEQFADIQELTIKTAKIEAEAQAKVDADEKAKTEAADKAKKAAAAKKKQDEEDEAEADIEEEFEVEAEDDATLASEEDADEDLKTVHAGIVDFFTKNAQKNKNKSKK